MLRLGDGRLRVALVVPHRLHRPERPAYRALPQERRGSVLRVFLREGEKAMFSHIVVGSNDIARSKKFYDAVFAAIGGQPGNEVGEGRIAYSHNGPRFIVTKPNDGKPDTAANGGTIGFNIGDPKLAEAWHKAGVANGGRSEEHTAELQ